MKLLLNVKSFNNEDVIATSGLCNLHPDLLHIYTYSINTSENQVMFDLYNSGDTTVDSSISADYDEFDPELNDSSDSGKWYCWNEDKKKFEVCTGNHDGYQKKIH